MIYLDNAATTLYKPQEVDAAILDALHTAATPAAVPMSRPCMLPGWCMPHGKRWQSFSTRRTLPALPLRPTPPAR